MLKRIGFLVVVCGMVATGLAIGQGRMLDMVANKVVTKYQNSTCEQLWEKKGQPKSAEEQRAVQFLRNDPQARQAFLNQVAGPIANKMFECGMIP